MTSFSQKEIEYIVAHRGLFQRAPIEDYGDCLEHPTLWRAVLDRSLLDYIKGPEAVGEEFAEVSAWLYEDGDDTDFKTVCDLAVIDPETAMVIFRNCRYERLELENTCGRSD